MAQAAPSHKGLGAATAAETPCGSVRRGVKVLEEENKSSDASEGVRRTIGPRTDPSEPRPLRHASPENKHGDLQRNGRAARKEKGRVRDLLIARDRRVFARVERGAMVIPIAATTAQTLAACVPIALPLHPRAAVTIAAHHHPGGARGVGQREPDQDEPGETRMSGFSVH